MLDFLHGGTRVPGQEVAQAPRPRRRGVSDARCAGRAPPPRPGGPRHAPNLEPFGVPLAHPCESRHRAAPPLVVAVPPLLPSLRDFVHPTRRARRGLAVPHVRVPRWPRLRVAAPRPPASASAAAHTAQGCQPLQSCGSPPP